MRVAFVHEWFATFAGSEKTLGAMHAEFPQADIFALFDVLPTKDRPAFLRRGVKTSFLQRLPFLGRIYRLLLPIMPLAVERLDLSKYDLVISNSHAVAKGVVTSDDQLHICFCHTPMRYAWDLQHQYLDRSPLARGPLGWLMRWYLHHIRLWDAKAAKGVDHFIANSAFIARRIGKAYGRSATVIYSNVDTDDFGIAGERGGFYLTASRLVPYKRIDLIVEAFRAMPDRRLIVIGEGPELQNLQRTAPSNVELMGYQPFSVLKEKLQTARAFVFAAEEDFGILPVEAQACGTPVIAYAKGGTRETVIDGVTGVHFHSQTAGAIAEAVKSFENSEENYCEKEIRRHAEQFSTQRFRREFREFVTERWDEHAQVQQA